MWVGTGVLVVVLVLVLVLVLLVMPTFAAIPTLALYRFVVRLLDEPVYRVQVL